MIDPSLGNQISHKRNLKSLQCFIA